MKGTKTIPLQVYLSGDYATKNWYWIKNYMLLYTNGKLKKMETSPVTIL